MVTESIRSVSRQAPLLGIPSEFGLPQLMTREVAVASVEGNFARMRGFVAFSTGLVAITTILIVILGETALSWYGEGLQAEKRTALRWGFCSHSHRSANQALRFGADGNAKDRNRPILQSRFAPWPFCTIPVFGFPDDSRIADPSTALLLQVAGASVALAASITLLVLRAPRGSLSGPLAFDACGWLGSAFPFALTEGFRVLQGNLAVFLLASLSTPHEIGIFRVADSTAMICAFPHSMFNIVGTSLFARLWAEKDLPRLQKLAGVLAACITAGVLALSIPVLVGGGSLFALIFGARFADSFPPFAISACGNLMFGILGPSATLLNMTGGERRVTRAFGASIILNVVIELVAIPALGACGASLGGAAGVLAWNLILWFECRRLRGSIHHCIGL